MVRCSPSCPINDINTPWRTALVRCFFVFVCLNRARAFALKILGSFILKRPIFLRGFLLIGLVRLRDEIARVRTTSTQLPLISFCLDLVVVSYSLSNQPYHQVFLRLFFFSLNWFFPDRVCLRFKLGVFFVSLLNMLL